MKKRILAIGTFDGVHQGHRRLLEALLKAAEKERLGPMVALFPYSPRLVLSHQEGVVRLLTSVEERRRILKDEFGIRRVEVLPMTPKFFTLSAQQFLKRIVVGQWGAQSLVFGDNFALGAGRLCHAGNFAEFARPLGLSWHRVPLVQSGTPVSSSRIRGLLAEGDLSQANRLLGRRYFISGRVVRGRKLASKALGFPTANLETSEEKILPPGVFQGWVRELGQWAAVNVGYRPTIDNLPGRRRLAGAPVPHPPLTVEAHILGYNGNLYGRRLTVELAKKIRNERRFGSLEELRRQIEQDVRSLLKNHVL